jgi:hypothetical protein
MCRVIIALIAVTFLALSGLNSNIVYRCGDDKELKGNKCVPTTYVLHCQSGKTKGNKCLSEV